MKKIECGVCRKKIDDDSSYCKNCGTAIYNRTIKTFDDDKFVYIFQNIYKTLQKHSSYTEKEFDEKFKGYKTYENRVLSDNDYYQILVDIIFYSGFKASTVDKFLERIHTHFPNYQVVSNYSQEDIERIKIDPNIIKHKSKIDACVHNAKKVTAIIGEYGSIKEFIESFAPNTSDEALYKLKKSLERNFKYIGSQTSYHFMMDIGLNVLKPDRVMLRIFKRLGLIQSENDLFEAVKVGRALSKVNNLPIRYIDIIFVLYGQLNQENIECICSENKPRCNICGVKSECLYTEEK